MQSYLSGLRIEQHQVGGVVGHHPPQVRRAGGEQLGQFEVAYDRVVHLEEGAPVVAVALDWALVRRRELVMSCAVDRHGD